ncbi:major capsid protein [Microviridae sp.]|nr:major capsid protein [Microviridae sp.]
MNNIFTKVQVPKLGRNRFNLSHDIKLSFNMGELIPTTCMEVVPGDVVKINVENMLRFAPLISPVMHKVEIFTHYYFVPNRILWPEWEDWITGQSEVEPPYITDWDTLAEGTVGDYLGLPINTGDSTLKASVLPMSAYLKIYDDYYRDQNLQNPTWAPLESGSNNAENIATLLQLAPLKRAWEHDYFTSCLPWAQKGDAVTLPLINSQAVPVTPNLSGSNSALARKASDHTGMQGNTFTAEDPPGILKINGTPVYWDPNGTLEVDINDEATTITTLRRAFMLQEWLELNARGGTRYIENIEAHFNVMSSDKRLQRPEYIGGGRQNMIISEVLSTAQTQNADNSISNPVGQMAGHGISAGGSKSFNYKAEEHGFIIGIINVQPVTAYQQGIHKKFSRETNLDYFWPKFQHIGEQEVYNKELYAEHTNPDGVFGYIPRYAEYKFENSRVAGKMRTDLDFWTLARIFDNDPALNSDFIECNPSRRIFAVTDPDEDTIYAHIYNNITASRLMAKYGIPHI